MLMVTDNAKQYLRDILIARTSDPQTGLRLTMKPHRQFRLIFDSEDVADDVVEYEGSMVLLVAPELAMLLEGVTIDTTDTPDGPRLVILNMSE